MAHLNLLTNHLGLVALWAMRLTFLVAAVVAAMQSNWETVAIVAVGFVTSFLPQFIERGYRIDLPIGYELIIVFFVFASLFLGEVGKAYEQLWWWDVALHTSSGVILGYVGFLVLYVLNKRGKIKMSAGLISFFVFALGMASAGLWEVVEFSFDELVGTDMQKGQTDTMIDIIVAGLGSLVAAGAAYWHLVRPQHSLIAGWVRSFMRHNPRLRARRSK